MHVTKNKRTPDPWSSKDLFVATRRRKASRVYESYEDMTAKIAEMERVETQESEDGSQFVDGFATVMERDHLVRVRLYGRRVTKTLLKCKDGGSGRSSTIIDDEMVQKRMNGKRG